MPLYDCYATVSGSKYLGQVEADNKEDAIEKAWNLDEASIFLCHQCSDECLDPEITKIEVEKRE